MTTDTLNALNIHTGCKALDWVVNRADFYRADSIATAYQFSGNLRHAMVADIVDWLKAHGASECDGRSMTGYTIVIDKKIDLDAMFIEYTEIAFSRGSYRSTSGKVDVMVNLYGFPLTSDDLVEMRKRGEIA